MRPLKIIFMGTPAFALPSLDLLYQSPHRIGALVAPPGSALRPWREGAFGSD